MNLDLKRKVRGHGGRLQKGVCEAVEVRWRTGFIISGWVLSGGKATLTGVCGANMGAARGWSQALAGQHQALKAGAVAMA